jgi:hypothetical protein
MNSSNMKRCRQSRSYDFDDVTAIKFPSPCPLSKNVSSVPTFGPIEATDFISELGSARSLLDDLPIMWNNHAATPNDILSNRGPFSFGSLGDSLFSGRFTPDMAPTSPESFSLTLLSPMAEAGGEFPESRNNHLHRGKFGSMKKRSALVR